MAYKRKTWREKLADDKDLPKVIEITGRMSARWGTGTCAIPTPREVDALMRRVPKGRVTTVNELRAEVARHHRATVGCPITTGIFSWIAAHAAEEAVAEGRKRVTPWWRTLKSNGELNPKFPGGVESQATRLRAEGIIITPGRGKKPPCVKDFEQHLAKF
jgi:alkylated DNA nucleotide flippase Atl1